MIRRPGDERLEAALADIDAVLATLQKIQDRYQKPQGVTMPQQTVDYFAISLFSSRTFWANALALVIAILSLTEVVTLIPPSYMPAYTAALAVVNIFLRTMSVRPVSATMMPGQVQPVEVKMLHATKPKDVEPESNVEATLNRRG